VVVIGKTAKHFSNSVREKLLLPTFSRALRDPFVPARKSAIAAFKATAEFYSPSDIAGKILPTITLHTIDPSRDVREVTFSTINLFLEVLVKNSAEMPEPDPNDQSAAAMSAQFDPQSSSAQASESSNSQLDLMGTISSWAIQAAANKLLNNSISSSSTQEQKPLSNQSFDHKPPPAYTFQSETHSKPKNKTVSVGSGWSDDVFLDPADGNDDDITIASLSLSTKKGSSGTSQPQKSVGPQPVDSWSDFDGLNSPTNNQASKTRSLNFDLAIGDDFSDSAADLSFDPFQSISSSSDPVKPLAKASSQSKLSEDDLFADLTKKPYDPLGSRKLKSQQQQQQQASSSFAKPKPSSTAATSSSSSSSKKNASSSKSSDMWEDFLSK
jgi:SCY1-like protein 1